MKLIKLVYISHGWMLGLYGRPLIQEDVEAWKYGPVIYELYREVKKFRSRPVDPGQIGHASGRANEDEFDEFEEDVMVQVLEIYGKRTAIQLSQLTHSPGTPWDVTYNQIGRSTTISNDLIEDHYARIYEDHQRTPDTPGSS